MSAKVVALAGSLCFVELDKVRKSGIDATLTVKVHSWREHLQAVPRLLNAMLLEHRIARSQALVSLAILPSASQVHNLVILNLRIVGVLSEHYYLFFVVIIYLKQRRLL